MVFSSTSVCTLQWVVRLCFLKFWNHCPSHSHHTKLKNKLQSGELEIQWTLKIQTVDFCLFKNCDVQNVAGGTVCAVFTRSMVHLAKHEMASKNKSVQMTLKCCTWIKACSADWVAEQVLAGVADWGRTQHFSKQIPVECFFLVSLV